MDKSHYFTEAYFPYHYNRNNNDVYKVHHNYKELYNMSYFYYMYK